MLNCKEVSRLVSESLDRKFPIWQRMGVWIHLSMCKLCRGFHKDLLNLRSAARQYADDIKMNASEPNAALSEAARERIKHALESEDSENQDSR